MLAFPCKYLIFEVSNNAVLCSFIDSKTLEIQLPFNFDINVFDSGRNLTFRYFLKLPIDDVKGYDVAVRARNGLSGAVEGNFQSLSYSFMRTLVQFLFVSVLPPLNPSKPQAHISIFSNLKIFSQMPSICNILSWKINWKL